MPAPRPRHTAAGLAAIAVLMSCAIGLARARDAAYPVPEVNDETLYLTSPKSAGRLALEFRTLAADLYWIRSLQYVGGIQRAHREKPLPAEGAQETGTTAAAGAEYQQLYPLLNLTTSLDPYFNLAYRFGAIFLSEPPPAGPGQPELAIKLLEKGLQYRPDKWEYMQDIGFVHYWWNHDYHAAAAAFEKASQLPGAPWWLRSLAATTLAQGGDRRSSRTMWLNVRATAEIDWLRQSADRALAQLDALDQIDQLQALVDRHRRQTGLPVTSWTPLIEAHTLPGIPLDPSGTSYELSFAGRVQVSTKSSLFPLPKEPGASASPEP
jgi:hypothetical protein